MVYHRDIANWVSKDIHCEPGDDSASQALLPSLNRNITLALSYGDSRFRTAWMSIGSLECLYGIVF